MPPEAEVRPQGRRKGESGQEAGPIPPPRLPRAATQEGKATTTEVRTRMVMEKVKKMTEVRQRTPALMMMMMIWRMALVMQSRYLKT